MNQVLLKELYEYELKRKEEIASRGNLLVTGLTLVAGVLGYMTQSFEYSLDLLTLAFVILITPAYACYGISLYCLARFYKEYRYEVIEIPQKLREHEIELEAYCKKYPSLSITPGTLFEQYIDQIYMNCTKTNARCNDSKAAYQAKAVSVLIYALIVSCIAAAAFFAKEISNPTKPLPIEVIISQKENGNDGKQPLPPTGLTTNDATRPTATTRSAATSTTSPGTTTKGNR